MAWWQITIAGIFLLGGFVYALRALEGAVEFWATLFWISLFVNALLLSLWSSSRERPKDERLAGDDYT